MYAAPTCPFGNVVVVMCSVEAVTVSVSVTLALCAGVLESVALKVSELAEAAAVGVPVMAPVAAFSDSPAGKVPAVSAQL